MSYFRDQLESWLRSLKVKGTRVLDVGGSAKPAFGRVGNLEFADYKILDNGLEPGKNIDLKLDINEPFGEKIYPEYLGEFDTVFCLEVFEYVWDPITALINISKFMTVGGKLFISFPFVYPMHKPAGKDYMRYTPHGAIKILAKAGFEPVSMKARVARNPEALKAFYASDGMHSLHDGTEEITGVMIEAVKV